MTYTLKAIGLEQKFTGSLNEAIELAKQLDEEYQRAWGVTVEDEDGATVATVESGNVERED